MSSLVSSRALAAVRPYGGGLLHRRTAPVAVAMAIKANSSFSTTAVYRKTAAETARDTLKTVDRAVSDRLVEGLDKGAEAAKKAHEVGQKVQGEAADWEGQAAKKAAELKDEAVSRARDLKTEAEQRIQKEKNKVRH